MRVFEKYAVKVGGGYNHRYNLSDGILLKDNHIGAAGGVKKAIMMAKEYAPFVRKIEIEVENLDMLKEALEAGADIIMLDNMSIDDMKEAVKLCKGKAETECSGNVTRENVARLVDIGVDYVSSGALTHSAPILDLSLKLSKLRLETKKPYGTHTRNRAQTMAAQPCQETASPAWSQTGRENMADAAFRP
jgi:nicotinate-nucleotide pyrophosphorylase (carboxylating)